MASSFKTLALVLTALLALSHAASGHRTTITIEEDFSSSAEKTGGSQSCREQVQKQWLQLRHCMMYMSPSQQSPYSIVQNPQMEHLKECCDQMKKMDEQCRCEAVKMMVKQMQHECKEEEMQQMTQEAKYLPSKCELSPKQCQIRAVWF